MPCIVKGVTGIAYDRLRPITGDHRGITARVSLERWTEYDYTLAGSAAESLVQPFRFGDSFEAIAGRVYGDPNLGEALRRRNPDKLEGGVGVFLHLPPESSLTSGFSLTPQSVTFAATNGASALRRSYFKTYKTTYRSFSLGAEWNNAV